MNAPKVTVLNEGPDTPDSRWDRWSATCECGWTYNNLVKTDVQDEARMHRADHRRGLGR